jgi:hypothetical protein
LRFGERCPRCGYQETVNWRPRFIRTEDDIVEAENVPELAAKLTPGVPYIEGQWVYYMPRTRRWIYRCLKSVYEAEGRFPDHRRIKLGNESSSRRAVLIAFNRNLAKRSHQVGAADS